MVYRMVQQTPLVYSNALEIMVYFYHLVIIHYPNILPYISIWNAKVVAHFTQLYMIVALNLVLHHFLSAKGLRLYCVPL